jgi:hypothetical protein
MVKSCWSNLAGQIWLVKSCWSNLAGQIWLVKSGWSNISGQILLVKSCWSNISGQILLHRYEALEFSLCLPARVQTLIWSLGGPNSEPAAF